MSVLISKRDKFRKKLRYVRYFGIFCFIIESDTVVRYDRMIHNIEEINRREIKKEEEILENAKSAIEEYKPKVDLIDVESLVKDKIEKGKSLIAFSKPNFARVFEEWNRIEPVKKTPHHVNLGVPLYGLNKGDPIPTQQIDQEAFIDLAGLYNKISEDKDKRRYLGRPLVRSSYVFVEAFLNSLAYNVLVDKYESLSDRQVGNLTESTELPDSLGEEDHTRLSTYEKIKKYTEYAGENPKSLYKDRNIHVKRLIEMEDMYRNSAVHPRPHEDNLTGMGFDKEKVLGHMNIENTISTFGILQSDRESAFFQCVEEVPMDLADSAVKVVKEISEKVKDKYTMLELRKSRKEDKDKFDLPNIDMSLSG